MSAIISPAVGGLAAGILFVVIFSIYSSQIPSPQDHAIIQKQSNVISFTKGLPIVREFLKRFPNANVTVNENLTGIEKGNNNDLGASIVTYSVERDLYPSEGHKELRLTIYVSKNYTVISSGMTCLGPVSAELSRTEPDMWIEAEKCIAK
ncbi:MAG: hypothetical protein ABI347_05625 [Nitrososphaera sp.]